MKKSISGEITQNVLKRGLSFLNATYHHDLIYITVKDHQTIPNGFQVIERTRNGQTDGRTQGSVLYPLNLSVGG